MTDLPDRDAGQSATKWLLEADGLSKSFDVGRAQGPGNRRKLLRAVDSVDLRVHKGEVLGLVGESGCGKSTLMRMLTMLEEPTSGSLKIMGVDTARATRREKRHIRRKVQIVLQDPNTSLDPSMTIRQSVREPLDIHSDLVAPKRRDEVVRELLNTVGLESSLMGRYPHELSGGQRQRVGIARALALSPEILVCDEPVSALDVSVQAQVLNLLKDLQQRLGLTVVFVAHDLSVVRYISTRVAVMYLGRIVEQGTVEEIYTSPTHPYTQGLLRSAPRPRSARLGTAQGTTDVLSGEVPSPIDPPTGCTFHPRCWKATELCAAEVPELAVREKSPHLAACHFASVEE